MSLLLTAGNRGIPYLLVELINRGTGKVLVFDWTVYGIVLVFDWTVYGKVLVFDWTVYGKVLVFD